jgi:hypothetical protein
MGSPSAHAFLSPSGAPQWTRCQLAPRIQSEFPNESGEAAAWGTMVHDISAFCLTTPGLPSAFMHRKILVDGFNFTVDKEVIDNVTSYINFVHGMLLAGGILHVEVKVPIWHITGEHNAMGTSDVVIIDDDELIVIDLKTGKRVEVFAEFNDQLLLYAIGAIAKFYGGDNVPKTVRMVIAQTGMNKISEWVIPFSELLGHAERIQAAAKICMDMSQTPPGNPGEKQCKYCRAKAICPALEEIVRADFEDVSDPKKMSADRLSYLYGKLPLHKLWSDSIAAEATRIMLAGGSLPGFKVVQGKQGNRAWGDDDSVIAALKSMDGITDAEIFDVKLKSPTAIAESDLVTRFPDQWHVVHKLITRTNGKPVVASESDKRPAIVVGDASASFGNVSSDVSDLI